MCIVLWRFFFGVKPDHYTWAVHLLHYTRGKKAFWRYLPAVYLDLILYHLNGTAPRYGLAPVLFYTCNLFWNSLISWHGPPSAIHALRRHSRAAALIANPGLAQPSFSAQHPSHAGRYYLPTGPLAPCTISDHNLVGDRAGKRRGGASHSLFPPSILNVRSAPHGTHSGHHVNRPRETEPSQPHT